MYNRVFRILVAVILVCCLVVSWSPIRVSATGGTATAGVISQTIPFFTSGGAASGGGVAGGAALGAAAFGYVLAGLGLIVTTAVAIDLLNQYVEYSGELETSIYYYPDGSWSYGVDMGFVERVKAFLWKQGILVQNTELQLDSANYPPAEALAKAKQAAFSALVYYRFNGGPLRWSLVYSNESQIVVSTTSGLTIRTKDSGASIYSYDTTSGDFRLCSSSTAFGGNKYYVAESVQHFGQLIIPDVKITIDGAEIGVVAPPEVDIPTGYPEWNTNARPATNPDTDEEITVLPIPFSPSADPETQIGSLTQPDIWAGSVEDAPVVSPPEVVPDTVGLSDIWQLIKGIPGALADVITGPIVGSLSKIWDLVKSIPQSILEGITAIFVPTEDFLTAKWEAIRSEFAFADSITSTGELLVGILNGLDPEPPVIYIDLGATEGSYNFGGEVAFIDLRWYARYKPTMDLIISAFLWMAFVWRLILKLPGIISGMPGEFFLMNLPVNLPQPGLGSGQRREELQAGRTNRRLGDGH